MAFGDGFSERNLAYLFYQERCAQFYRQCLQNWRLYLPGKDELRRKLVEWATEKRRGDGH